MYYAHEKWKRNSKSQNRQNSESILTLAILIRVPMPHEKTTASLARPKNARRGTQIANGYDGVFA
jgi:hypothetical protein